MKEEEEEELPPELDKSAEVEVASAAATSSTQPPPPPAVTRKLPIKRLVKLKDPTTSGQAPSRSSPMEVRKVVIQRMDAKKVIVQRDFRHVVHPPIIIRYRVPVIRSRFVPVSKLRAALPPVRLFFFFKFILISVSTALHPAGAMLRTRGRGYRWRRVHRRWR